MKNKEFDLDLENHLQNVMELVRSRAGLITVGIGEKRERTIGDKQVSYIQDRFIHFCTIRLPVTGKKELREQAIFRTNAVEYSPNDINYHAKTVREIERSLDWIEMRIRAALTAGEFEIVIDSSESVAKQKFALDRSRYMEIAAGVPDGNSVKWSMQRTDAVKTK